MARRRCQARHFGLLLLLDQHLLRELDKRPVGSTLATVNSPQHRLRAARAAAHGHARTINVGRSRSFIETELGKRGAAGRRVSVDGGELRDRVVTHELKVMGCWMLMLSDAGYQRRSATDTWVRTTTKDAGRLKRRRGEECLQVQPKLMPVPGNTLRRLR